MIELHRSGCHRATPMYFSRSRRDGMGLLWRIILCTKECFLRSHPTLAQLLFTSQILLTCIYIFFSFFFLMKCCVQNLDGLINGMETIFMLSQDSSNFCRCSCIFYFYTNSFLLFGFFLCIILISLTNIYYLRNSFTLDTPIITINKNRKSCRI